MIKKLLNRINKKRETLYKADFDGKLIREIINEKLECNGTIIINSKCGKRELFIQQSACSRCVTSESVNLPGLFINNPKNGKNVKNVIIRYYVNNADIFENRVDENWSSAGFMSETFKTLNDDLRIEAIIE